MAVLLSEWSLGNKTIVDSSLWIYQLFSETFCYLTLFQIRLQFVPKYVSYSILLYFRFGYSLFQNAAICSDQILICFRLLQFASDYVYFSLGSYCSSSFQIAPVCFRLFNFVSDYSILFQITLPFCFRLNYNFV